VSDSSNIVLACRLVAAFTAGDEPVIEQVIHPAHREHATPGSPRGPDGVRQALRRLRAELPGMQITTEDIIASGDRVVMRIRVCDDALAHEDEQIHIWRVAEGLLAEHWMVPGRRALGRDLNRRASGS
jgi:predicted SnoaL-like aldol condensation-catalyzing enzyme